MSFKFCALPREIYKISICNTTYHHHSGVQITLEGLLITCSHKNRTPENNIYTHVPRNGRPITYQAGSNKR
jgi:hypothetical protein